MSTRSMTILQQLGQPIPAPGRGVLSFDGGEVRWGEGALTFTVVAAGLQARLDARDPGTVQLSGDSSQRLLHAMLRTRDGRRLALVAPVDDADALEGLPPIAAQGARVELDALLEMLRAARQMGVEMAQVQVQALPPAQTAANNLAAQQKMKVMLVGIAVAVLAIAIMLTLFI